MTKVEGCETCGHIVCVCRVIERHEEDCKYRKAVTCPVGIECEHGYDVCPKCDPCTSKTRKPVAHVRA